MDADLAAQTVPKFYSVTPKKEPVKFWEQRPEAELFPFCVPQIQLILHYSVCSKMAFTEKPTTPNPKHLAELFPLRSRWEFNSPRQREERKGLSLPCSGWMC